MDKSSIMDTYAIKQWYESWDNLVNEKINEQRLSLYYDFNAVIDLIQEELKKKIADRFNGGFEKYRHNWLCCAPKRKCFNNRSIMILTDKAKEDFIDYLRESKFKKEDYKEYEDYIENQKESHTYENIIEWFDSVGVYIYLETGM